MLMLWSDLLPIKTRKSKAGMCGWGRWRRAPGDWRLSPNDVVSFWCLRWHRRRGCCEAAVSWRWGLGPAALAIENFYGVLEWNASAKRAETLASPEPIHGIKATVQTAWRTAWHRAHRPLSLHSCRRRYVPSSSRSSFKWGWQENDRDLSRHFRRSDVAWIFRTSRAHAEGRDYVSGCTAGILRPNELQALKRLHRNCLLAGLQEGAKARMESLARASKRPFQSVQTLSLACGSYQLSNLSATRPPCYLLYVEFRGVLTHTRTWLGDGSVCGSLIGHRPLRRSD